jgi:hypothetical protein
MNDPVSGRFLQTDPVGYQSDVNLYAYVGEDPTNRADPSGDGPEDALATIGDAATYLDATGNPGAAEQQRALVTGVGEDLARAVREDPVGVANVVIGALTEDPLEAGAGAASVGRTLSRDTAVPTTRSGAPNPYGRLGGPAHQADVGRIAQQIESRGLEAVREHRVLTPRGAKGARFVDVAARDPKTGQIVEMHQVGTQPQSGSPVAKENKAMNDIQNATGTRPDFHPYN